MKHLVRRGFLDVGQLILVLPFLAVGLLAVVVIADQAATFWALAMSIKTIYYILALLIGCLIRFIVSLVTNFRRAEYASRHHEEYSFEEAAKIIGDYPDAFEFEQEL